MKDTFRIIKSKQFKDYAAIITDLDYSTLEFIAESNLGNTTAKLSTLGIVFLGENTVDWKSENLVSAVNQVFPGMELVPCLIDGKCCYAEKEAVKWLRNNCEGEVNFEIAARKLKNETISLLPLRERYQYLEKVAVPKFLWDEFDLEEEDEIAKEVTEFLVRGVPLPVDKELGFFSLVDAGYETEKIWHWTSDKLREYLFFYEIWEFSDLRADSRFEHPEDAVVLGKAIHFGIDLSYYLAYKEIEWMPELEGEEYTTWLKEWKARFHKRVGYSHLAQTEFGRHERLLEEEVNCSWFFNPFVPYQVLQSITKWTKKGVDRSDLIGVIKRFGSWSVMDHQLGWGPETFKGLVELKSDKWFHYLINTECFNQATLESVLDMERAGIEVDALLPRDDTSWVIRWDYRSSICLIGEVLLGRQFTGSRVDKEKVEEYLRERGIGQESNSF